VKVLEAAGLVELVEERQTRNYIEKFYSATAAAFTLSLLIRPQAAKADLSLRLRVTTSRSSCSPMRARNPVSKWRRGSPAASTASSPCARPCRYRGLPPHRLRDRSVQRPIRAPRVPRPRHRARDARLPRAGLIVASGNPLGLTSFSDIAEKQGAS